MTEKKGGKNANLIPSVNLALTDPAELEDLLASKGVSISRQKKKVGGGGGREY